MQVILTKDIKHIGQAGDIVSVKKGYARNFLLLKKWAIPFTAGSAKETRHRKEWILSQKKKALSLRQSLAEKLKGLKLSFVKEASPDGKLFGSITVLDISKELNAKGYEVDKKIIKLTHPLKEIGEHKVCLEFNSDLKVDILIDITAVKTKKSLKKRKKEEESDGSEELNPCLYRWMTTVKTLGFLMERHCPH